MLRKPKTVLIAALAVLIAPAAVGTEQAQAHKVTNRSCHVIALQAARAEMPATIKEVAARKAACREWGADHNRRHEIACNRSAKAAIRCVFGRRAGEALRVASCESSFDTTVLGPKDEYGKPRLGLFQLGTYERKKSGQYTRWSSAMTQTRSAYSWFAQTGYDWGAWECKP